MVKFCDLDIVYLIVMYKVLCLLFSEPRTDIIGGPEIFIDRGSTINLTCIVLHSPEPPSYIFWNHNNAVS